MKTPPGRQNHHKFNNPGVLHWLAVVLLYHHIIMYCCISDFCISLFIDVFVWTPHGTHDLSTFHKLIAYVLNRMLFIWFV